MAIGYTGPFRIMPLLRYSGLYWAIQGCTWLHWAIPDYTGLYKAILECTWLCLFGYTELFWVIMGYTVSAATAIVIRAKV